jgi:glycosyltransferase involved in cell wall biosynthesis
VGVGVNIGIFTDTDCDSLNGVTTTLTAAMRCAPAGMRLRIYTAATLPARQEDYLALGSVAVPTPFFPELRLFLPRLLAYAAHATRDQLDVVHLTTPGPLGLAALFVARKHGLPLVGSVHSDVAACAAAVTGSPRLAGLMRRYLRWLYAKCDRLLVPSQQARRLQMASGIDPRRMALWRRGVDTRLFAPSRRSTALRERWHVSDRRPALLYVGRVAREKGLGLLPPLRDRLHALGIEHRLIVVGHGPLLPHLREALPDAVFTGALSREEVAEAFASADMLVFPSRLDTAGNVLLEAQASGLPVVIAGDGGAREHMLSGRTGVTCYSEDAGDWAAAVATLARRADLPAMRESARQYALTRRWERTLEPLYRTYRDVCPRAAGAPVTAPAVTAS